MNKTNVAVSLAAGLLCMSLLAGCGGNGSKESSDAGSTAPVTTAALAEIGNNVGGQENLPETTPEAVTEPETTIPETETTAMETGAETTEVQTTEPETSGEVKTEYGSGSYWVLGEDPELGLMVSDELLFEDGVLVTHYIEDEEGKGGFGGDSGMDISRSRFYGMTVEEVVKVLEEEGRKVTIK